MPKDAYGNYLAGLEPGPALPAPPGGDGGTVVVIRGSGAPSSAPEDPTAGAIYYDDNAASPSFDTAWHWSVPAQEWIGA